MILEIMAKPKNYLKWIVKLRMWYADIRGHHGKRWNYEPGDWYMGRHKKWENNVKNVKKPLMQTMN